MSDKTKGIGIGSILTMLLGSMLLGGFTYLGGQTLQIPVMQQQNIQLVKNIELLNISVKEFIHHHVKERTDWKIWRSQIDTEMMQSTRRMESAILGIDMAHMKCESNDRRIEVCEKHIKKHKGHTK